MGKQHQPAKGAKNTDLEQFLAKFEPNKFKVLTNGIEIRGLSNVHNSIQHAKDLIAKFKLNLTITHNADMVQYGGFEVNAV